MNAFADLSPAVLMGISGLILVQLTLQIAALVSLVRTPSERIVFGGRKWIWALIIVLGEIIGPIVYFVAGRQPAPAVEVVAAQPASKRAERAADTLYGAAEAHAEPEPEPKTSDPAEGSDGTGMGELP